MRFVPPLVIRTERRAPGAGTEHRQNCGHFPIARIPGVTADQAKQPCHAKFTQEPVLWAANDRRFSFPQSRRWGDETAPPERVQIYRHPRHLRHSSNGTAAYDNVDRHCYRHRWHDHRHRPIASSKNVPQGVSLPQQLCSRCLRNIISLFGRGHLFVPATNTVRPLEPRPEHKAAALKVP
jgi:hypothetical protein